MRLAIKPAIFIYGYGTGCGQSSADKCFQLCQTSLSLLILGENIHMHFGGYIFILYFSFHLGFNSHQRTPLHVAAEESHTGLVRYLIDKGASTDIQDMSGVSATTDDRISRCSVYQ